MLALFVFAAIPAVSVAQGLDAAVLAELMRDEGRRLPPREPDSSSKGLKAAASLTRRLGSTNTERIARPRAVMTRRIEDRPAPIATIEPPPARHDLEESLLSLPPPAR
jgi:plasmid replication initiation protein